MIHYSWLFSCSQQHILRDVPGVDELRKKYNVYVN